MRSVIGRAETTLDANALARLRLTFPAEGDLKAFLKEFLTAAPPLVAQIERGNHRGSRQVELAAHTLKSMARIVGAEALAEACRVVEFAAHGPKAGPLLTPLVRDVMLQSRKAREAVQRLLA